MPQDPALQASCAFFNKLDKIYTENLDKRYTKGIIFDDPIHHFEGITALEAYYRSLYDNVTSCRFDFHESQRQDDSAFVTWTRRLLGRVVKGTKQRLGR